MRREMIAIFLIAFVGIAFSQETPLFVNLLESGISYLKNALLSSAEEGGSLTYITFGIILVLMFFVIYYLLYHAANKFFSALDVGEGPKKALSVLLALIIDLIVFSQPSMIMAIILLSAAPLTTYLLTLVVLGIPILLVLKVENGTMLLSVISFLILVVIYYSGTISGSLASKILGIEISEEKVSPYYVVSQLFGVWAAEAFGIVLIVMVLIAGINVLRGKGGGR